MNCKKCGKEIGNEYELCYKCGDTFDNALKMRFWGHNSVEPAPFTPGEQKFLDFLNKHKLVRYLFVAILISFALYLFWEFFVMIWEKLSNLI